MPQYFPESNSHQGNIGIRPLFSNFDLLVSWSLGVLLTPTALGCSTPIPSPEHPICEAWTHRRKVPDMSTYRGARPLIERGYRLLPSRQLHETSFLRARPAPRRSPRVNTGIPPPSAVRVKRTYDFEESLPPISLLNSARKSGVLVVEPHKALEFLREYQALAVKSSAGWERRLCAGEQVACNDQI